MGKIITMEVKPSYGLSDKKLKKKIKPITLEIKNKKSNEAIIQEFKVRHKSLLQGYKK
jgi:hypothetical protein|tara:strand:+ start:1842 stop:2015 length:174 start_codon:yes stop_codon:yes gene_type:complete